LDLERGSARRLYSITEKPDVSRTPVPRFDLLALNKYTFMSVQFSRGCPFTCEFCDIITIYGRRPRTKSPAQLTGELDSLLRLGWRKDVFVVDDNFIGNHKAALELVEELERWQRRNRYPFGFFTEASIDLASRPALLDGMVKANFWRVFIGIESPSAESLKETKKLQNLRRDLLESVRFIQQHGLWVMGGFIVGFDSDRLDIFDRQIEFVQRAAIPWAMTGILQAPPTTPLYERMKKEGRLLENKPEPSNFNPRTSKQISAAPSTDTAKKSLSLSVPAEAASVPGNRAHVGKSVAGRKAPAACASCHRAVRKGVARFGSSGVQSYSARACFQGVGPLFSSVHTTVW